MSRYYQLVVTPTAADGTTSAPTTWTNKGPNGAIPGAQMIEFDVTVATGATPVAAGSWVRVWGPTKEQIQQASDWNGASIELYGGMQNGLPLATQAVTRGQAGLLISGKVQQAFGNWQGITQTLDFVIVPKPRDLPLTTDAARQAASIGAPPPPQNFTFSWALGSSLTDNVTAVLQQAYPGIAVSAEAASDIILLHDEFGSFPNLQTFSTYVQGLSRDIKGPTYPGLNIAAQNNGILVFDNTTPASGSATDVSMYDLVGQVTWLDAATVTFTTVLRADIGIADTVTFPPLAQAQAVTTASSQSYARISNTFNGQWKVNNIVRHVGNSRSADAQSWVSIFQASPTTDNVEAALNG